MQINFFIKTILIMIFLLLIIPQKKKRVKVTYQEWKKDYIKRQNEVSKQFGL